MADFLGMIIGDIVNIVTYLSHLIIILFRNFIFFAFIAAFLWGIFRLCQSGWRKLRGRGTPQETSEPARKDDLKIGDE